MPKLSFHRLPLQDQNLLEKWLVNIRANINVNSYSRVCSAHFEGGKKQGKNDVPTVFAWTKAVNSRPPPKQRPEPVVSTPRFHSIGITTNIQSDNHVERAIGLIKNFKILKSVPNSMHNMANQLFFVCSILTNFQPTLVE